MPSKMVETRLEIIKGIIEGLNDMQIADKYHHGRNLVRTVRKQIESGELNIFNLDKKIGRPKKRTPELESEVVNLTIMNRRMGIIDCAKIISENFTVVSPRTVANIRHDYGFKFLPPKKTFLLSDEQKAKRIAFAQYHLQNETDWSKVLFTDESMFVLGDSGRWLWRRRGETDPAVFEKTEKFHQKVMIFGGFTKGYQTPLIAIDGTMSSETYIDECLDGTGCIFEMDKLHGKKQWYFMQDGASIHTSKMTMDFLNTFCNVLPNWPANSPDLNPIENLWAILKRKVEELRPQTKDDLINIIFDAWRNIDARILNNLIDSMKNRLQLVIQKNGEPNGY